MLEIDIDNEELLPLEIDTALNEATEQLDRRAKRKVGRPRKADIANKRAKRMSIENLCLRVSDRIKRENNIDISKEDLRVLHELFLDEIASSVLQGYKVPIPPMGILSPSSAFMDIINPKLGVRIKDWFKPRLALNISTSFYNTLRIYELSRRPPEDHSRFKRALITKVYDDRRRKKSITMADLNPDLDEFVDE